MAERENLVRTDVFPTFTLTQPKEQTVIACPALL